MRWNAIEVCCVVYAKRHIAKTVLFAYMGCDYWKREALLNYNSMWNTHRIKSNRDCVHWSFLVDFLPSKIKLRRQNIQAVLFCCIYLLKLTFKHSFTITSFRFNRVHARIFKFIRIDGRNKLLMFYLIQLHGPWMIGARHIEHILLEGK